MGHLSVSYRETDGKKQKSDGFKNNTELLGFSRGQCRFLKQIIRSSGLRECVVGLPMKGGKAEMKMTKCPFFNTAPRSAAL